MGYSIDPISADCYEGTTCLNNNCYIVHLDMIEYQTLRELLAFHNQHHMFQLL